MDAVNLEGLSAMLASRRSGERLRAMDAISAKVGGRVVRLIDDRGVVSLLIEGLTDSDRRVQRAAARGLRPWIAEEPGLLEAALEAYAGQTFDGSYSHAALFDTQSSVVWIPRFAAVRGHAALLPDANTDRYFRFDFFVPNQAPNWIGERERGGHVAIYFVPEWSYSRQVLIPDFDERRMAANRKEQERYAGAVADFYERCDLPYDVHVHHVGGGGGHHRFRELNVRCIKGREISEARRR